jgi:O-antigen/teichoic acid export membrane protein
MKKVSDIAILTTGKVLLVITSIVSIRIFTTLISPYEVGRLNILSVIYGWFGLILIVPVGTYVNRKIIEWNRKGLARKHLCSVLIYFFLVTIFAIISLFGLRRFIGIDIRMIWILLLTTGSIMLTNGNNSFLGWINLFGRRFCFVFLTVLTIWLGLVFSIFFAMKISPTAEYWLIGQLIAQGCIFVLAIVVLFRSLNKVPDIVTDESDNSFSLPVVFTFAWPFAISTFLYWIQSQGYQFAFKKLTGFEILGLFAVGLGVGNKLMIPFEDLFNQYYRPIFYNEIADSNEAQRTEAWNKYAMAFFPAVILMVAYVAMNGSLIAKVFTGEKFHRVGCVILWGGVAGGLQMISSVIALVSHAQFKTKPLIVPAITLACVSLIGIFLLVPWNPFMGGGIALSMGWFMYLIHLYINMKKQLLIKIPWKRIYYSVFLSGPLIVFSPIIYRIAYEISIPQALVILAVSGLYWLFAQFILARKWLSLPLKMTLVDDFEAKVKMFFYR